MDLPTEADPVRLFCGDALDVLRTLPDECARTCVTSPPYYGLRDYGTATWEGGAPGCDHRPKRLKAGRAEDRPTFGDSYATHGSQLLARGRRSECDKCGAVKTDRQVGLEESPAAYAERLVGVFREVRRVLAGDGTLWLNLGDSYATKPMGAGSTFDPKYIGGRNRRGNAPECNRRNDPAAIGAKHKDLLGVPWLVAFALRADGWYLRQDVIWAKPNPQPESVTDRCTKSHEYLFLLAKSQKYLFDKAAIAEPCAGAATAALKPPGKGREPKAVLKRVGGGASFGKQLIDVSGTGAQSRKYQRPVYLTRNKRSVWVVTPRPYKGAHFAVFPAALIEPCVRACSRPGDVVLDPFAGSGTTLQVARNLGRRAIGIDLNPAYHELIRKRLAAPIPATIPDPDTEK
jgi:DNA modification methylase